MLRSIMRDIAAFDIVHLRVRTPLPRSTHGLLAFRPLLVAFAAVARRAVDVVRLALAMMDSPYPGSVAVRLGRVIPTPCRAAAAGLAPVLYLCYPLSVEPSTKKVITNARDAPS